MIIEKEPNHSTTAYGFHRHLSSSNPDHIQIEIEGSKAILTPEKGWTGAEEAVFTAQDSDENMIVSDIFMLHVAEGEISIIARLKALFS